MTTISKETHPLGGIIRKKPDEVPAEPPKSLVVQIGDWIARLIVIGVFVGPPMYLAYKLFNPAPPTYEETGPLVLRGALPTSGEAEHGWIDPTAPVSTPAPVQEPTVAERQERAEKRAAMERHARAIRGAGYWCGRAIRVLPDYWNSDANQKRYTIYCDDGNGLQMTPYTLIHHHNGRVQLFPS
ncbi:hypothetical protein VQ042_20850 [Aurantimonas sp. A2-1-M11]